MSNEPHKASLAIACRERRIGWAGIAASRLHPRGCFRELFGFILMDAGQKRQLYSLPVPQAADTVMSAVNMRSADGRAERSCGRGEAASDLSVTSDGRHA